MSADDVRRVELGSHRRRWWPFAVAGAVVWGIVAFVVGAGGGGDDDAAPATSSTTTTVPTARTLVAGEPVLGRTTGWSLVVAGTPTSRVVDLDTAATTDVALGTVLASRSDGVIGQDADGFYRWHPFPFDDASVVRLDLSSGQVFPLTHEPSVWISNDAGAGTLLTLDTRLVSLEHGRTRESVTVGALSTVIGVAGDSLVVNAGGDTFAIGTDGVMRRIADGAPIAVAGTRVLVTACNDTLHCSTDAYDLTSGAVTDVPGLGDVPWFVAGPANPDGWLPVVVPRGGAILLGPDGRVLGLPDAVDPDQLVVAAWSPDGEVLFVPTSQSVLAVAPFADGGPTIEATIPMPNVGTSRLAVVLQG